MAGTVTGANTVAINTGGAMVDGKAYQNSASVNVNVPSAVGGGNTRIDRIVLRASWAAYTVRITRIAGTDAASPTAPAITQTAGTTYDITLYQALVNTAGAVTLTDERVYGKIATAGITDANITLAKMAANSVDSDQYVDGSIDLAHMSANSVDSDQYVDGSIDYEHLSAGASKVTSRQGGNATDWSVPGTTTYTPTAVRIQCGTADTGITGAISVTFPVAFSNKPVVVFGGGFPNQPTDTAILNLLDIYANSFSVQSMDDAGASLTGVYFSWIAIGPV